MVLSKKQKILGVALGAAVAIFVGDRVLLGLGDVGPAEAEAAALPADSDPAVADPPPRSAAEPPPPARAEAQVSLAARLAEVSRDSGLDPMTVPDAFRPPRSWLGTEQAAAVATNPAEAKARAFAAEHRLTATAVGTKGGMAIINGQCFEVGRSVSGFRLVSVEESSAVLTCDGITVTLRLPMESSPGGGE